VVKELQKEGVSVALIDARFAKPLDAALICEWTRRIPWIVTVEENVLPGGFGSAVLELLCDCQIPFRRIIRLGIGDHFVEHGPQSILREQEGIDSKAIAHAVRTLLQERKAE
jgi:1-deoxy-D-xylulose-5-phosphate synthase